MLNVLRGGQDTLRQSKSGLIGIAEGELSTRICSNLLMWTEFTSLEGTVRSFPPNLPCSRGFHKDTRYSMVRAQSRHILYQHVVFWPTTRASVTLGGAIDFGDPVA